LDRELDRPQSRSGHGGEEKSHPLQEMFYNETLGQRCKKVADKRIYTFC